MNHIFTKMGDNAKTSLLSGETVEKASLRVDAYGTIDEAVSFLGQARSLVKDRVVYEHVFWLQNILSSMMAELAQSGEGKKFLNQETIDEIEKIIIFYEEKTGKIKSFIAPGNGFLSGLFHVCRAVLRRAERAVCRLFKDEYVSLEVLAFLNRASDLSFLWAKYFEEEEKNDMVI